ncbi:MAG: hypothetical protein U1D55_12140 [Phycisphaerae bacterium]
MTPIESTKPTPFFSHPRSHTRQLSFMALVCALGCGAGAVAQIVNARQIASKNTIGGQTNESIWETSIAAGSSRAVAVYNFGGRGDELPVGYAVADLVGGQWVWQSDHTMPSGEHPRSFDPTVAYNPLLNTFIVCAHISSAPNCSLRVGVSHFNAATGLFGEWKRIEDECGDPEISDRPTILAGFNGLDEPAMGAVTPTFHQEYYIVWYRSDKMFYAHSTDDGINWVTGSMPGSGNHPNAAVYQGGPLYVAYRDPTVGFKFKFLKGTDNANGTVSFVPLSLRNPDGSTLEFVDPVCGGVLGLVPNYYVQDGRLSSLLTLPWIAADPTNPDRLYLVYHALDRTCCPGSPNCPQAADEDVNVYLRRLTRLTGDTWEVSAAVKVNDDDPPNAETPSDQFLPSIHVDSQGRIHVAFYDDRDFPTQRDGGATEPNRFNAYYARSTDGGLTFDHVDQRLFLDSNPQLDPPAGDLSPTVPLSADWEMGEYLGITSYRNPVTGATAIWTSFNGITPLDTNGSDKSVIWASRVDW